MTKETGTLAELNVQPGDVVADALGMEADVVIHEGKICVLYKDWDEPGERNEHDGYRIISRASDTPKTWGEMTDAEKERSATMEAIDYIDEAFDSELAQRIRDELGIKPEPKRETLTLYGSQNGFGGGGSMADSYEITFDTLNDEPICGTFTNENGDSIRMEKIGEGDQ